jgi:hypothetical protein
MPKDRAEHPAREVYLLFAHEAYYPTSAHEINTSLVAAASLLHPRVRQPDGARIYGRLTRGRRQGEIVPLSTLTHELDGGAHWPQIGDWEAVTTDLLQLILNRECDALSLGLPDIDRALVCSGPHSMVRAYDPVARRYQMYGPADRAEVLTEIGRHLKRVAERSGRSRSASQTRSTSAPSRQETGQRGALDRQDHGGNPTLTSFCNTL